MSVAFGSQCKTASAEPQSFIQDRFAIGFWVDPPIGDDADSRYKEIADANFTVVLGGFGADLELRSKAWFAVQLEALGVSWVHVQYRPHQFPPTCLCLYFTVQAERGHLQRVGI